MIIEAIGAGGSDADIMRKEGYIVEESSASALTAADIAFEGYASASDADQEVLSSARDICSDYALSPIITHTFKSAARDPLAELGRLGKLNNRNLIAYYMSGKTRKPRIDLVAATLSTLINIFEPRTQKAPWMEKVVQIAKSLPRRDIGRYEALTDDERIAVAKKIDATCTTYLAFVTGMID